MWMDGATPQAIACSMTRPASQSMPVTNPTQWDKCAQDSDCTEGTNGRCIGGSFAGYYCSYDTCFSDGDCAAGRLCDCNGRENGSGAATTCKLSDCRTDADCGANGYCSPSYGSCGDYSGFVEWHSAQVSSPSNTCRTAAYPSRVAPPSTHASTSARRRLISSSEEPRNGYIRFGSSTPSAGSRTLCSTDFVGSPW